MPNSTWNPADKSSNVTLSGTNNLIATLSTSVQGGVRTIDHQVTGKFYWEYTCNTFTASADSLGVINGTLSLALQFPGSGAGGVGSAVVAQSGLIWIDGAYSGTAIGTIASGTVVCVAYDAGARLLWFRPGAAGTWNNSGTANPATAVGGLATPNIGNTINAFPVASLQLAANQVTANFGDSAFSGAVPAGFTAGFGTGGGGGGGGTTQARVAILA